MQAAVDRLPLSWCRTCTSRSAADGQSLTAALSMKAATASSSWPASRRDSAARSGSIGRCSCKPGQEAPRQHHRPGPRPCPRKRYPADTPAFGRKCKACACEGSHREAVAVRLAQQPLPISPAGSRPCEALSDRQVALIVTTFCAPPSEARPAMIRARPPISAHAAPCAKAPPGCWGWSGAGWAWG